MVVAVIVGIVALLVVVVAASVWLSRRSPAALSEEAGPSGRPAAGGQGRPAGPGAEAMAAPEFPHVSTDERSE